MLTILLPVTRDWTREAVCKALGASDIPRRNTNTILVFDAPVDEKRWGESIYNLGFDIEMYSTGNTHPPDGLLPNVRRPRQAEMREFTTQIVDDGPLLTLDDDTIVPPNVYRRLSYAALAHAGHAAAIQVGRYVPDLCGVYRDGRALIEGHGIEPVDSCGHYCLLTTGEMYRQTAVPLDATSARMRPIPGLVADWDCVCGHLTREGVLWPR